MKLKALMLGLVLCLTAARASAHGVPLVALFNWQGPAGFTVKLADPYGAAVPGDPVKAVVKETGQVVTLTAQPDGSYAGQIAVTAPAHVTVDATVQGDLFRATVLVEPSRALDAQPVPMTQFERGAKAYWELGMYGGVVVLVSAVFAAELLRQKRKPAG